MSISNLPPTGPLSNRPLMGKLFQQLVDNEQVGGPTDNRSLYLLLLKTMLFQDPTVSDEKVISALRRELKLPEEYTPDQVLDTCMEKSTAMIQQAYGVDRSPKAISRLTQEIEAQGVALSPSDVSSVVEGVNSGELKSPQELQEAVNKMLRARFLDTTLDVLSQRTRRN